MKYQLATIIVTNNVATGVRQLSSRLDRDDLGGMFSTGLSANEALSITHWISSGYVPKAFIKCMRDPALMFVKAKEAWEADGEAFPFTQSQVTNALNNCVIVSGSEGETIEPPLETIARLGLKIVHAAQ